jgi:hypothetical protein
MPDTNGQYLIPVYGAYAVVSITLTVWIARTLFKNGAVFLEEVFADQPKMAEAVNRLLVVGFYLLNLGYASLIMKMGGALTAIEAVEALSSKLGMLLLSLGGMHFFNLYLFHRIRQRSKVAAPPPALSPRMMMPPNGSTLSPAPMAVMNGGPGGY